MDGEAGVSSNNIDGCTSSSVVGGGSSSSRARGVWPKDERHATIRTRQFEYYVAAESEPLVRPISELMR